MMSIKGEEIVAPVGNSGDVESAVKRVQCEAKYGHNECENEATKIVISRGLVFHLCKSCARLQRLQDSFNK